MAWVTYSGGTVDSKSELPESRRVKNIRRELLSDNWYWLHRVTYDYRTPDGKWEEQVREVYHRGNGAAVLLYNPDSGKVVLTRQFRMPTFLNGNPDGHMVEVCAGILEDEDPEGTILNEIEEETGYRVKSVEKAFESYMSPGSVTEVLHFFTARYGEADRLGDGGGLNEETEHIEVIELPFSEALDWVHTSKIKDAKTILLLQYAALHGLMDQ